MGSIYEHWFAAVLFVAYTGFLIAHARAGMKLSRGGVGDYFVGGRRMGGVVIGISFFATFASTNSYLGHAGKGYAYGAPWLIFAVLIVVFTAVSWLFVAPKLRRFTELLGCVTVPDYLAARFESDRVRLASAIVIAFSSLLYLIAIFKGAGNLFQMFLGIPYEMAVGLTLLIVMVYTSVGGFLSVVRTDVVQGVLMLIGSVLIFTFVTDAAGGVGSITSLIDDAETAKLFTLDAEIPFAVLIGIALAGSLKLLIDPRQLSRFYGLQDDRGVRSGIWVAVIGILIIQFSLFPVGLYAHLLLDGVTDTDLIVPTLVTDTSVFPLMVADFLLVAITAAAMSSMDSVLLVAASTTTRDVIGHFDKASSEGHRGVRMTRFGVIGFAALGALIALDPPGGIVEITIFSGSLYAVCFVPTVLLGLHWRRGDGVAALAAIVVGVAMLAVWLLLGLKAIMHEVFPALVASTGVYIVVSLVRAPVATERVAELFSSNAHQVGGTRGTGEER